MRKALSSKRIYESLVELIEKENAQLRALSRAIPTESNKQVSDLLRQMGEKCVTKRTLARQLYETAITDGLTGFRTRAYFENVLREDLENEKYLGYLICDVDHFKSYNDTYGHAQGDVAVKRISSAISRVAQTDEIVRYGGEEFSIFVIGYKTSSPGLKKHAEQIRMAVRRTVLPAFSADRIILKLESKLESEGYVIPDYLKDGIMVFLRNQSKSPLKELNSQFSERNVLVDKIRDYLSNLHRRTISIGGAIREDKESLPELMDRADDALYEAKQYRDKVVIAT